MKYVLILAILLTSMLVSVAQADVNFNNTDDWSGTSGSMITHGDGGLRAPPSITTGLVSYWNPGTDVGSGSTLTDIWGSNDGTIYGASWNGDYLYYDGINDYIDCGNDNSLNIPQMSFISQINQTETSDTYILSKAGSYRFKAQSGLLSRGLIYIGSSLKNTQANVTSFVVNQTYDVTMLYDGTEVRLYVDKNETTYSTQYTGGGSIDSSDDIVTIGNIYGESFYFKGFIGSSYIYNTALTTNQINETYEGYHTLSSYREIDTVQDSGAYDIWDTIQVTGTDVGANTSITIYINGSDDNVVFNGLELIGTYDVNDLVDIPIDKEYRYAKFKIISTTTYQPETNIINNIELVTKSLAPITSEIYVLPYSDEAYIMWTIDRLSNNVVEYSLNSDMSSSSYSTWDNTTTNPMILLEGLTRDTTYYYEVTSVYYGNSSTSSTLSFTTQNNTHGFSKYFDRAFVVNDIDGWSVGQSMFEAYADSAGEYITWTLILGSVFLAITIRTESVIIPAVLALISAVVVFPLLPPEHDIPAKVLLALAISGIIWHQFIGRR